MGAISDIASVIGLATKAVELAGKTKNLDLKEVIVELKGKLIDLKEEIVGLREENARLTEELKRATESPKESSKDMYGCLYFDDDTTKLYCPKCYQTERKKHLMARVHMMGFQCTVCDKFIHR